jgi:hypothetical protein
VPRFNPEVIQVLADRYGMSAVLTEFTTRVMSEFRKPVLTRVEVSWQDAAGTLHTVAALMEDKSAGGARIRVNVPIEAGIRVRIQSRLDSFSGTARYCRAEGREFLIGIQRDDPQSANSDRPVVSPVPKIQNPPTQPEPGEVPDKVPGKVLSVEPNVAGSPANRSANSIMPPARAVDHALPLAESTALVRNEFQTQLRTKQPPTQAAKEDKPMRSKWLELPWRKKPDNRSLGGPEDGEASSDEENNDTSAKENDMSDLTQPAHKPPVRSAREVPTFQVDLSPMEDIYRSVGIMNPPRGYSINKVVEMLNSEHIRNLSNEMKRAALLMALDAAGTSVEQVQKDANARQNALDSHEAQQRKQVEAEWARKAEEIVQIQAEMESIKAHYMARISRNMDGVARQKATFADWVSSKQQECQGMAEAVELCLKAPVAAPPSAPASQVSLVKVSAKTV